MSERPLLRAWALLMGLTLLTGTAGVGGGEQLGSIWLAVLALVTILKARIILARYLGLAGAPSYLAGFTTAIVAVIALIALSVMATHWVSLARRPPVAGLAPPDVARIAPPLPAPVADRS